MSRQRHLTNETAPAPRALGSDQGSDQGYDQDAVLAEAMQQL